MSSSGGADIGRRGQQYAAESRYGVRQDAAATCDFIGFGFGPSNLALAVAARELAPSVIGRFFEQNATFQWHPGMMFDDARMQVPFLKDLVTLRNPASPYTFLQYVKAKGRLERFVNLREFHPTRKEFEDYLAWVADAFRDQVQYAAIVERVTAITQGNESVPSIFRVQVRDADGKVTVFHTKNVVSASGGQPRLPKGCVTSRSIVHSSEFLKRFPSRFPDCAARHDFAVVGDGQSAGEITAYLLRHYANARVHLHIPSFAPRQADSSPFVNEAFFSCEVDSTFFEEQAHRGTINGELRNTNYGVMDSDLINQIYRATYLDEVRGERRLFVHRFSTFLSADDRHDRLEIVLQKAQGEVTREYCDALVLATGYEHRIDPAVFEDLLPLLKTGSSGELVLSRNYRVQTTPAMNCGLYLQGAAEASHGIGNTLLSLLPFRTKEILDDICNNSDHGENPDRTDEKTNWTRPPVSHSSRHAEYPPQRHLDTDLERLYAVIAQFKFATLISVQADGEPIVTHVPLILNRARAKKGVLFGHMDRANPHADLLAGQRILAIFHGPNAYISPHVYQTDQLPTWNSIAVHVRGKVRVLSDRQELVRGLMGICEQSDPAPGGFRLDPQDPRIERLIDFIVGFEIEIDDLIGRFKLSQDRTEADRKRAAQQIACNTGPQDRALIERLLADGLHEPSQGPV